MPSGSWKHSLYFMIDPFSNIAWSIHTIISLINNYGNNYFFWIFILISSFRILFRKCVNSIRTFRNPLHWLLAHLTMPLSFTFNHLRRLIIPPITINILTFSFSTPTTHIILLYYQLGFLHFRPYLFSFFMFTPNWFIYRCSHVHFLTNLLVYLFTLNSPNFLSYLFPLIHLPINLILHKTTLWPDTLIPDLLKDFTSSMFSNIFNTKSYFSLQ